MEYVQDISQLEKIYGQAGAMATRKVANQLTPSYTAWISRSRFCILSTVGPEGTDATPRGDDGPVVRIVDAQTLALPDWHGNNRMDALRNIVRDPRVSLLFIVAGSNNVVRVNGTARVTVDADQTAIFQKNDKQPRSIVVVKIAEVYFQCARALLRAKLWSDGDQSDGLPTAGKILAEMTDGTVGGADYDLEWPKRASKTLW